MDRSFDDGVFNKTLDIIGPTALNGVVGGFDTATISCTGWSKAIINKYKNVTINLCVLYVFDCH
jgi:hypothetical protein